MQVLFHVRKYLVVVSYKKEGTIHMAVLVDLADNKLTLYDAVRAAMSMQGFWIFQPSQKALKNLEKACLSNPRLSDAIIRSRNVTLTITGIGELANITVIAD